MITSPGTALRTPSVTISVHDTTAGLDGSTDRATIVCSASTISAAMTIGSISMCGRAAWPPRPVTAISKLSSLAMMPPDRVWMCPASIPGQLCRPNMASIGKRASSPSASIAFAPRPCSSAGWKTKRTVPSNPPSSARRAAAPSTMAMWPSCPHACITPSFCERYDRSPRSFSSRPSMSARRPITFTPSPRVSDPTTPVPPTPRTTSTPRLESAAAT
ncbi:unannotated protein [freshwater metagenome]|uniref:Unannotated protein n=1 Tax=freshwater metagenome TaxID=449393 RepID=A0A6J6UFW7_9ZZZZ